MSTPVNPNDPQGYGQQPPQGYGQQPPQGYGQQTQYAPPPMTHKQAKAQAKALRPLWKKKRFWLGLILGLIVLSSIINAIGGSDPSTTAVPGGAATQEAPATKAAETTKAPEKAPATKAAEKAPTTEVPNAPKIGDSVDAGVWNFEVTKIKCGAKEIGNDFSSEKAQGQFCLLTVNVKNNGDKAETLFADNQKLLDDEGKQYSSDDGAWIYLDDDEQILAEEINPGNTAKGVLVFDIPKDVKPVQASLAGGLFGIKDVATIDLT